MNKKLFIKTIAIWFLLAMLATTNGIIRNAWYKPAVGDLLAHQISTFVFIIVLLTVSYLAFRRSFHELSDKTLLLIGFIWVLMTEAFEFLAGHYLFGNSWEKLFADYNIFAGRIWILVVVATLLAPYLSKKIGERK